MIHPTISSNRIESVPMLCARLSPFATIYAQSYGKDSDGGSQVRTHEPYVPTCGRQGYGRTNRASLHVAVKDTDARTVRPYMWLSRLRTHEPCVPTCGCKDYGRTSRTSLHVAVKSVPTDRYSSRSFSDLYTWKERSHRHS